MKNSYQEKRECKWCENTGKIKIYDFRYVTHNNRIKWNKDEYLKNLMIEMDCPMCDGKGYIYIYNRN